nr:1-aminocyclopropane-1-carboxylate oxidase-like [Cherax quadricarinatus]
MSKKELPVIDLRLAKGSTRGSLVRQLREALTTVGFIYLTGVDGYDENELLRLTRWFFSLPLEDRMKISRKCFNPECKNEYRGYFPVIPGEVSHKEGFEIGPKMDTEPMNPESLKTKMDTEPMNPDGEITLTNFFQTWMENYHQKMTEAALELLRLIAEGFDAPSDFFTSLFVPRHLSTLRLIHYPARTDAPEWARDGEYVIQTAEHQDSVMLTLLATFQQYPGLQVRWMDDTLLDVPHRRGHLVVNIGVLLSTMSGGNLKATRHRVVECGGDRFSVPFFLEPKFDGNINQVLPSGTPQLTEDPDQRVFYGPWLWEKTTKYAEYKGLIERLKSVGLN